MSKLTIYPERRLALAVAAWAGASTLAYEVLWSRVLRYFVDTSLHSFAIVLTAFLCGLAVGSALVSRFADSPRRRARGGEAAAPPSRSRPRWAAAAEAPSRDLLLLLGALEVCAGAASVLSLEVIAHTTQVVAALEAHADLGRSWSGQAAARLLAFSAALLLPTALLGGTFPVLTKLAADSDSDAALGGTVGQVYGANTAGGALGSLVAGFALLPCLGVQKSIVLLGGMNVAVGVSVLLASRLGRSTKVRLAVASAALFAICMAVVRPGALTSVYTQRYAPPGHELLFLSENVSSTTAVFRQGAGAPGGQDRRYLVIDGRGEVSTDYFSMRAFRLLGLLPAFYAPRAASALIVTFGSGIVAGAIASLPDVKEADCVEICADAFQAAHYFAAENHDVLESPKVRFIVGDGRNHCS